MGIPDPSFRENPARAIYIHGYINQQLLDRLTPQILRLLNQSREPITAYIDSPGGSVATADTIIRLLKVTNQDSSEPCQLVTVVTSRAASAAADFLSAGDYAIAYPETTILYHGTRVSTDDPLTVERASALAENLKTSNQRFATELTRKSEARFMFRIMTQQTDLEKYRETQQQPDLPDLECFLGIIEDKLSYPAREAVKLARERHGRYDALVDRLHSAAKRKKFSTGTMAETECIILKQILDFEVKTNKHDPRWTFSDGGLARLSDDFFLLLEYVNNFNSDQFKRRCERWAPFALSGLSEQERNALESLLEEQQEERKLEIAGDKFRPFWAFFVALCHALQERDHELTATDALWLGLVDEVIGHPELPCMRQLMEDMAEHLKNEAQKDNLEESTAATASTNI